MTANSPLSRISPRALVEGIPAAVVVLDEEACAVAVSRRAEELLGYGPGELTGWPLDMVVVAPLTDGRALVRGAVVRCRRKDGTDFLAEVEAAALPDGTIICTLTDADRTVGVADRMATLQRRLDVLAAVEAACERVTDPDALATEVCRIAVESGGLVLAWIALLDGDRARIAARHGFAGTYLDGILADPADGDAPSADPATEPLWHRALVDAKPVAVEALDGGPIGSWRAAARRAGYRSAGAVPIVAGRRTLGVLELHAGEEDAFDADEIDIFRLVAGRVGAALAGLSAPPG